MKKIFRGQVILSAVYTVTAIVVFLYTLVFMTEYIDLFGLKMPQNKQIAQFYEVILQGQAGMVARLAGSTAEALATMGEEPPDVILADYNLDDADTGIAAIIALRAAAGQPIPAVMVTARRDPDIARACADIGVPLLEKPVRPSDLQLVLEQLLA